MTQQEVQKRNKQIALMLGAYTKQMMGVNAWVLEEDELNLSFDLFDEKLFSNNGGSGWLIKDLKFHKDWNWLMEAVEFIEKLQFDDYYMEFFWLNGINVSLYQKGKHTGAILWETHGRFKNVETKKEAVFIAVSDFAKKFNNKEI